jgi:AAA+ ATPase superfamily predicted ATPase
MISVSFPVSGEDFVNRQEILRRISLAYQRRQNIALVGPRRIGKTSIAKEFLRRIKEKDILKVIFDVQENLGTPARFILRLIKLFLTAHLNLRSLGGMTTLLEAIEINPDNLLDISSRIRSKTLEELARFLIAYYSPSSNNERVILEKGLRFLDEFAQEQGVKVILILDEFQSIKGLEKNIGKGENILALVQGIISSSKHSWYLFTGSMVRLMTEILEDADSPFYGRAERINVEGFTKEDMISLFDKIIHKPISGEATQLLWTLTKGNPYYTVVITSRAIVPVKERKIISREDIEKGFIESITAGELNSHCRYIHDISLGRMKDSNLSRDIIKFLSSGETTPTVLAASLRKDRGFISPYLSVLQNLSLIEKIGNKYCISDYVFRLWVAGVYGASPPHIEKIRKNINQNYQESFARLKSQMGYFFESYIREMLRKFNNTKFQDRVLPKFKSVESLNIYDEKGKVFGRPSNIEVDALCRGKENWLCEFRCRNELTDKKDMDLLIKKQKLIESKLSIKIDSLVFISTSGFTEETLTKKRVWCITTKELNTILKRFNMRGIDELEEMGKQ